MSTLSTKIVTLAPVPAIINLVSNPNTATGWLAANGGATLATTQAAGDLPLGTAITTAIKITSGTSTRAEGTLAETTSYAFTTPAAYAVKTGVEFWLRPGTNFLNNEWTVSIYAGATRQSLTTDASAVTYIPNALGKFTTYFDAVASTAYTVRFTRTVNAGTNAGVLNLANVIVGPGIQPQGAVVGPVTTYTPTVNGLGTGSSTNVGKYTRVGQQMVLQVTFTKDGSAGTGGTPIDITLPTGLTIDSAAISNPDTGVPDLGTGFHSSTGAIYTIISVSTDRAIIRLVSTAGTYLVGSDVGANVGVSLNAILPIAEWAGSGTVNVAQNDVEYASNSGTWDTTDTTSFAYGPAGSLITGALSSARDKTVSFSSPIAATDTLELEFQVNSTSQWLSATLFGAAYSIFNTTQYGAYVTAGAIGSNTAIVSFTQYANPSGAATYAAAGSAWVNGWRWRVIKTSGGQAVGFGAYQAASTANPAGISGLVPAAGLPGRTDGVAVPASVIGERINSTALSQTATVTANTAVDVSGSALPLTPGVWLVYFMGLFRIRNLSVGALSVSGAIQLVTNAGVFAGGLFEVAGLQTLTGSDTTITASFAVPIVVAANTTYKLQVINSASAANSIAYFSSGGTFGNDGDPLFYGLRIG